MALSRYARLDTYTFEELRRDYGARGSKGRIRLLKRLAREGELEETISQLGVEDPEATVRQWVARHVDLSKDQVVRLKSDSDEFVRACLFENPATRVFFASLDRWLELFAEANHTERLAMMRNPNLGFCTDFIEILFDSEDTKLGIDLETRAQYVVAVLSNKLAAEANNADNYSTREANKRHFAVLWTLITAWPPQQREVRHHVYRNVSVDGETKLHIYRQSDNEYLRRAILENELPELTESGERTIGPSKVLEEAKKDSDEACRRIAYSKSPTPRERTPVRNALSYGWTTVTSIVEMLVAVLLLLSASARFETVTYCLLVMIYVSARSNEVWHGLAFWEQALLSRQRYIRLLDLLRDPLYTKELRKTFEAETVDQAEEFRHAKIKRTIRSICLGLIGIGAAIYLVAALV